MELSDFCAKLSLDQSLLQKTYGLDQVETQENLYFFTGKAFSTNCTHLGHLFLYSLLARIARHTKSPLLVQLAGDEKRYRDSNFFDLLQVKKLEQSFLCELAHVDFTEVQLDLFSNCDFETTYVLKHVADYVGSLFKIKRLQQLLGSITVSLAYAMICQVVPMIVMGLTKYKDMRPVVVTAEDQVPCFLMARSLMRRVGLKQPLIVCLKPVKDLMMRGKMSSSQPKNALSLSNLDTLRKAMSGPDLDTNFAQHFLHFCELGRVFPTLQDLRASSHLGSCNDLGLKVKLKTALENLSRFKTIKPSSLTSLTNLDMEPQQLVIYLQSLYRREVNSRRC